MESCRELRIHLWNHNVAKGIAIEQTRARHGGKHSMSLRASAPRTPLVEILPNSQIPNPRKRKRQDTTSLTEKHLVTHTKTMGDQEPQEPRKRGRPPKLLPPEFSKTSQQKTRSPDKSQRGKSLNKICNLQSLDLKNLETALPSVALIDLTAARKKYKAAVPQAVLDLHKELDAVPFGLVPPKLQSKYKADIVTPEKSKAMPPHSLFGPTPVPVPLDGVRLDVFKEKLDDILAEAAWNQETGAHERQWGNTAAQLLHQVIDWIPRDEHRQVQLWLVNIETSAIEPIELQPSIRGCSIVNNAQTTQEDTTTASEDGRPLTRMIDWGVALLPTHDESTLISEKYSQYDHIWLHSLNQTYSFARNLPFCLDIELKKAAQNKDPRVQLAIWAQAGYKKRKMHEWDTTFPMPGIAVDGHDWTLFLFFSVVEDQLVMLGPIDIGSTKNLERGWKLVHSLHILLKWGVTEYRKWYNKEIIGLAESEQALRLADDLAVDE
ncbi:uncharacterized protein KY384_002905 [Bacidia gigantensis]|uniref:uncharacterized protein n=1 Tax=Bacidia gigantensis TaxID=2732470 RepID=UPI001D04CCBE|nr:uncharacterized protein KY384_002905 [Bacidia gigantensis]KAG8532420.1 hypothetical protein KY384_002905 [Bacidia gigantensis]